jgi:hypothetical protein
MILQSNNEDLCGRDDFSSGMSSPKVLRVCSPYLTMLSPVKSTLQVIPKITALLYVVNVNIANRV